MTSARISHEMVPAAPCRAAQPRKPRHEDHERFYPEVVVVGGGVMEVGELILGPAWEGGTPGRRPLGIG